MIIISIPPNLQSFDIGHEVAEEGETVKAVLEKVAKRSQALRDRIFNDRGEIYPVGILVDGTDLNELEEGDETPLTDGIRITILQYRGI